MTQLGKVSRNKCSREEAQEVKRGPKKKEEALLIGSGWEKGEGRGDRGEGGSGERGRGEWRDEAGCWGGTQAPLTRMWEQAEVKKVGLGSGPQRSFPS